MFQSIRINAVLGTIVSLFVLRGQSFNLSPRNGFAKSHSFKKTTSYFNVSKAALLICGGGSGGLRMVFGDNSSQSTLDKDEEVQINDVEAELIAKKLKDKIDIPGIPDIIENPVLEHLVKTFFKVSPSVLPKGVFNKLLAGDNGIQALEKEIILKISDKIFIPLIPKGVQNKLVELLCNVLFKDKSLFVVRRKIVKRSLKTKINEEAKEKFGTKLNSMVDLPLLNDRQEQKLAERVVGKCLDVLESFIPERIMKVLEASTPEAIQEVRDNLVDRLNEKVDIPWKSEEEEKKAYRAIVDLFLSFYGLGEEYTQTPEERLDDVEHDMMLYKMELDALRENTAGKEKLLVSNLKVLKKEKKQLSREINGGPRFGFLKIFGIFKVFKFWKRDEL